MAVQRSAPARAPHLPPSSFSIGDLLRIRRGRSAMIEAVRWRQVNQFTRIGPKIIIGNLLIAAMDVGVMAGHVPTIELLLWLGTCAVLCGLFAWRHHRLTHDPDYRIAKPASFASATIGTIATTLMWWVVPLLWFPQLPSDLQLAVAAFGVVLMSTGAFMLVYVPPASVAYTLLMSVAGLMMAAHLQSGLLAVLVLLYCISLVVASLVIARELFVQTRSQMELSEMGELVELLRELDAPGSGGLWELDSDLNFTKMSQALNSAITLPAEKVKGRSVFKMIDPDGRYRNMSSGVRQLFGHFREEEPFRDVVVPQVYTDRWWSLSGRPHYDEDGKLIGWKGVASDVTEARTANADALGAARSDPLTGIANRLLIRELLEQALLGQMNSHGGCALLLVDLDRFKLVNDTLGHAIGDKLLCAIAERLEAVVGTEGHVGRLGGDEFAIIWHGDIDRYSLSGLAERVIAEVSRGVTIGAANINVGATIGIAIGPEDGNREDRVMRSADLALYSAKRGGRGGYAFYDRAMLQAAEDHRLLENDVREALKNNDMRLAYQPIVDARTGKMVGREALLRWRHATRGEIAPDRFIPIIEDAGLIHQIGDWVIREACTEAAGWDEDVRVAVNISAAQLTGAGLAKTVVNALALSGLHPHRLELEVTESVFLGDDPDTLASIERLRGLGVRMVLDDFGKGYSSFGYLSRAHFSKIKIDASFVRAAAAGDQQCVAIVNAILALASGLGIETTAEGVETAAQADIMRELGIGSLQGYLFGRPEILGVNVVDMARHRRDIA
ncbi:putative bifunctional diguanylate cyclase/phosphodiesterase [Sphingomicrobium aestuariivivum]|uniref:putative bifunctional diguanylate cyclase/phosphodiesterase n=1 Tax=Sphingomicrobium aestuariivivum TaxID=1582356 RepID=UPI001FD65808|nr:EAL domain-containing protein [Sphingomicrobium aestuariivivum]MCJ8191951.1 EAL domain-containing protein [Sphingomicrobium aestuariivivum]